jgi:hypothetical protein
VFRFFPRRRKAQAEQATDAKMLTDADTIGRQVSSGISRGQLRDIATMPSRLTASPRSS